MPSEETGFEPDGPPAELLEEFTKATAGNGAAPAATDGGGGDQEDEEERRLEAVAEALTEELALPAKRCRLCEAAPGLLLAALGAGLIYVGIDLATGGALSRRLAGPPLEQEGAAGDGGSAAD